jgi:hypothetical protein
MVCFPPSYSVVCPHDDSSSIIKECIRIQLAQHNLAYLTGRRPNRIRTRRTSIYKTKQQCQAPLKKLSLEVMRERRHVGEALASQRRRHCRNGTTAGDSTNGPAAHMSGGHASS